MGMDDVIRGAAAKAGYDRARERDDDNDDSSSSSGSSDSNERTCMDCGGPNTNTYSSRCSNCA